ncbi:leucine-rich repeat domain-containing protein, partial [Dysgonomonas sp. OttesenSCG-928-M03]|nr:leucine-rich repeat domain-containing protein [Dysgonomonas sp. OttesenSCG-928-M03]
VILPNTMLSIPMASFTRFKGSVVLQNGLEEIGNRAFYNASLTKALVLPASLKVIRNGAFENATLPGLSFDKMGGQSGVTCF